MYLFKSIFMNTKIKIIISEMEEMIYLYFFFLK